MSGLEIPGIEIQEKVGAGGMATVWKARQISLNRTVAVKILYSKLANDPADLLRFQHEAQAAARLKHQGIVQVYDANVAQGAYYFIMEFIAGYTVGEWVKRRGALSVKDALLVTEAVAEALRYAWTEAGIIHCDIKPDNILVDADGTVKVSDLGLARTLSQMRHDAESDYIMGTPAYMAPEHILGEGELSFRGDIYALGATLYHMVTGQTPFGGQTTDEVMDLQVNGTLPDPIDLSPDIPAPVCWLIEKMMSKDPEGRQDSWEAVIQDLARAKKGLRPLGEALPAGVSTVARSANRVKAFRPTAAMWNQHGPGLGVRLAKLALVLTLVCGGLFLFMEWQSGRLAAVGWVAEFRQAIGVSTPVPDQPGETISTPDAGRHWGAEFEQAVAWVEANPGHWDEAIARLTSVADGAAGTPYGAMACGRVDALRRDKQARIDGVLSELSAQADALVADKRWEDAAQVYAGFAGEFAAETETQRATRAAELRAQAVVEPQRPLDAVMASVTQNLLAGQLELAVNELDGAIADPGHAGQVDVLGTVRTEVAGARDLGQRVLNSLIEQKGLVVDVELRTGRRHLRIKDVQAGRVVAQVVGDGDAPLSQVIIEFEVGALSARENLRRMGGGGQPGGKLYVGLMAREFGARESAARYFAQTPEPLATLLAAGASRKPARSSAPPPE